MVEVLLPPGLAHDRLFAVLLLLRLQQPLKLLMLLLLLLLLLLMLLLQLLPQLLQLLLQLLSAGGRHWWMPRFHHLVNDGYGTQRHIIDGPFNNIHRWEYTKIRDVLNYGRAIKVDTKGALEKALKEAALTNEMYLIEAIIPRDDCSRSLRRMGEKLGELRNKDKQH